MAGRPDLAIGTARETASGYWRNRSRKSHREDARPSAKTILGTAERAAPRHRSVYRSGEIRGGLHPGDETHEPNRKGFWLAFEDSILRVPDRSGVDGVLRRALCEGIDGALRRKCESRWRRGAVDRSSRGAGRCQEDLQATI